MLWSVCEATVTLAQEVLDIIMNLLTSAETKWFASLSYISHLTFKQQVSIQMRAYYDWI